MKAKKKRLAIERSSNVYVPPLQYPQATGRKTDMAVAVQAIPIDYKEVSERSRKTTCTVKTDGACFLSVYVADSSDDEDSSADEGVLPGDTTSHHSGCSGDRDSTRIKEQRVISPNQMDFYAPSSSSEKIVPFNRNSVASTSSAKDHCTICDPSVKSTASVGSMLRYFSKNDEQSERLHRSGIARMLEDSAGRLNLSLEGPSLGLAIDAIIEEGQSASNENNRIHRDSISKAQFRDICKEGSETLQKPDVSVQVVEKVENEDYQVYSHSTIRWRNKQLAIYWTVIYVAAQIGLFAMTAISISRTEEMVNLFGMCIAYAKAFALLINFNAALALLPVSKHLMTWLQSKGKDSKLVSFDGAIAAHRLFGWAFIMFSVAHSILHIFTFLRFSEADQQDVIEFFGLKEAAEIPVSPKGRLQFLLKHRVSVTGLGMLLCIACSVAVLACRRSRFNRFWYLHHLLVVALILMCIHGTGSIISPTQTIYWLLVPLFVYVLPRLYREVCSKHAVLTNIRTCGNILELTFEKPLGWELRQKAGMYLMMNVPTISRFEWHPFTISSAPFQKHLRIHINCTGDWTKQVKTVLTCGDQNAAYNQSDVCTIRLEGLFGAPIQRCRDFECVVLIGAGIGVTPMISTLHTLLHNPGWIKKVYFYWTVRDNSAFRLFEDVMEELYEQDLENRLEIRQFLTSTTAEAAGDDKGSRVFQLATQRVHEKTDIDIRLGHRSKKPMSIGRPKWEHELNQVVQTAREISLDNVGVFLCGPDRMAKQVESTAMELSARQQIRLQFFKEIF